MAKVLIIAQVFVVFQEGTSHARHDRARFLMGTKRDHHDRAWFLVRTGYRDCTEGSHFSELHQPGAHCWLPWPQSYYTITLLPMALGERLTHLPERLFRLLDHQERPGASR